MESSHPPSRLGILCIVSGPSGSGKTTLCRAMSQNDPRCVYAVSCTTRAPREGEVDGEHYHFLTEEAFQERIEAGDFLEHAQVHQHHYGTLKTSVREVLDSGRDVLLDIDVQGASQVRSMSETWIQDALITIFILVRDRSELSARLTGRGTEGPEALALRMRNALEEMACWQDYDFALISGTPDQDRGRFLSILDAERCRTRRIPSSSFDWTADT